LFENLKLQSIKIMQKKIIADLCLIKFLYKIFNTIFIKNAL